MRDLYYRCNGQILVNIAYNKFPGVLCICVYNADILNTGISEIILKYERNVMFGFIRENISGKG